MTGDQFSEVDVDLLADYVGGALDGTPDEAVVAQRIADDPAWRAAYDELAGAMATVGAQLHELGGTAEPMPADVAARLDAALAGAPPRLTVLKGGVADSPRGRRRPRWTAPVAVAAAVVVFAGVGGSFLLNRTEGSNDSATSTAAGSAEEKAPAPLMAPSVPLPAADQIRSSGTDYQAGTLRRAAVRAPMMSTKGESTADSPPFAGSAPPLAPLSGSTLQECLDAVATENGSGSLTVESVDYARYAEKPALVVVFTAANGRFAWASGPDCGAPGAGADRLNVVPVG